MLHYSITYILLVNTCIVLLKLTFQHRPLLQDWLSFYQSIFFLVILKMYFLMHTITWINIYFKTMFYDKQINVLNYLHYISTLRSLFIFHFFYNKGPNLQSSCNQSNTLREKGTYLLHLFTLPSLFWLTLVCVLVGGCVCVCVWIFLKWQKNILRML